ncbi:hypothetical protein BC828DRAFT_391954 [Blastocladiella britannica]|nr:hypothetical protein BC828DRAFT_391954 [Blastocladiella britannica]
MNLLDLPDDLLEDIARFLDAKAVAATRAASHAAAASPLALTNRVHIAYIALCRNDVEQFYAAMPRYQGKRRSRHTRTNRLAALALFAEVATYLVRGNIGFPGRSWAILNAWSHGSDLMTTQTMTELTRLALDRGASRALVTLLTYRGRDPLRLAYTYGVNQMATFFGHPRVQNDSLRLDLALELATRLAHGARPSWAFGTALLKCDPALLLTYICALDVDGPSLQVPRYVLDACMRARMEPVFSVFEALMDAFYLSRQDPSIATSPLSSVPANTLQLVRARLEAHVSGNAQIARRLSEWMVHVDTDLVHNAIYEGLGSLTGIDYATYRYITPRFLHWAARYLVRDTAPQAARVHHAVSFGFYRLPSNAIATELAVAYVRGFPIDFTHFTEAGDPAKACFTCERSSDVEASPTQWLVKMTPASDLEMALARRTADAALHSVLVKNPYATHARWIRVLQTPYLRVGELFRAWGEAHQSERQLLLDAGVVGPFAPECGLGGAGIQLSTLTSVYLIRIRSDMSWRTKFVDAIAAAREAWPVVVAGWRMDTKVAQHLRKTISAYTLPPVDPDLNDIFAALDEAGIPVDVTLGEFLSCKTSNLSIAQ